MAGLLRSNLALDQTPDYETEISEDLRDPKRGFARGPERALLSALLFDGVQSFMHYLAARTNQDRLRYREAFNWVTSRGNDYVFSFDNVCDGLGINPDSLRCGILNACNGARSRRLRKAA